MQDKKNKIKPRIGYNNKVLFVGINPVIGSFKEGRYHYFSNNSQFYTLLKESGFTSQKENDLGLKKYNYGIINFCDYISQSPAGIPKKELQKARRGFESIIKKYSPLNIVFLGKFVPQLFFGMKKIKFGRKYIVSDTNKAGKRGYYRFFVVPFPTSFIQKKQKLQFYREVLENLDRMKYKRIYVFGATASGKTTLAKKISIKLKIPFYSMDDFVYKDNYSTKYSEKIRDKKIKDFSNKKRWVIEGVQKKDFILPALKRADLVILLLLPRRILLTRVITREIKRKFQKNSKKSSLKDVIKLLKWTYDFKKDNLIRHKKLIKEHKKKFIVLKNKKEINNFLENLK